MPRRRPQGTVTPARPAQSVPPRLPFAPPGPEVRPFRREPRLVQRSPWQVSRVAVLSASTLPGSPVDAAYLQARDSPASFPIPQKNRAQALPGWSPPPWCVLRNPGPESSRLMSARKVGNEGVRQQIRAEAHSFPDSLTPHSSLRNSLLLLHHAACDPVPGIARRVSLLVVGMLVDHHAGPALRKDRVRQIRVRRDVGQRKARLAPVILAN